MAVNSITMSINIKMIRNILSKWLLSHVNQTFIELVVKCIETS